MPKKEPKIIKLRNELTTFFTMDELEDIDLGLITLCINELNSFEDPRQLSKIEHKLSSIVMLVILCLFAGVDEWKKMEGFAKVNETAFRKLVPLENGIPSHDTIQRVFAFINPNELTNLLVPLFKEIVNNGIQKLNLEHAAIYQDQDTLIQDIYSFDGKEIRKSGNKYKTGEDVHNFNTLNVYSTEFHLSLMAERIESKTNEIPTMIKVMKFLDLKGIIATFDALNTQKSVVASIVEARGDYVGVLKKNHGVFYEELESFFNDGDFLYEIKSNSNQYLKDIKETKRQKIVREYFITENISWFYDRNDWKGLKSFGYELKTKTNNDTGEITVEKRYFLNSIKANADLFSLAVRRHWNIENNLHWHLDVTFKEDYVTTKNKAALHNLTIVRRFVLAVLNLVRDMYPNTSLSMIRNRISWAFEKEMNTIFTILTKLRTLK